MDSQHNTTVTDRDCICPVCFKPINPAVMEQDLLSADGIRRRSYSVWCPECSRGGQGYIVIQFYNGGRWRIEKYIPIRPLYVYDGDWQQVQPPMADNAAEPAPVIQTGPGGDFTAKTTDQKLAAALESYNHLIEQLASCGGVIRDILLNRNSNLENRK